MASLAFDANGNLYGETTFGGEGNCDEEGLKGCGIVFRLAPSTDGWTEDLIHEFPGSGEDGFYPESAVTLNNRLYSLTTSGGSSLAGAAYEITP
ncbi:MAG: choice-of-anchor tandem repeat GloVer-containing protein [Candidatus Sulfotelmatobacter sp.]